MKENEPIKGMRNLLILGIVSMLVWFGIIQACRTLVDSRHQNIEIVDTMGENHE